MRNANSQCAVSMIPARASQQAAMSHVSHAVTEGMQGSYSRQRCDLLTMKSRNAWTRATVFSSSG
jgi:hypothetical protein